MKLSSLIQVMEHFAPLRYAESWDNVGLLAGDPEQTINRVMLTIDYTPAVASESAEAKCDCVIAYHPPLFQPTKQLTTGSLIYDAIRRGIAIYSPHTALDVADGGTNDVLADALMMVDRSPLKFSQAKPTQYKLVTFVPKDALEKVSNALFAAGAGRIGQYSSCSFRSPGTGTFFGEAGTNPAIGEAGRLEEAQEIRLETIVPINLVELVIRALRESHPYEEPAFDLNQLAAPPEGIGIGRIGKMPGEATAEMLVNHLKRELEIDHVLFAGDPNQIIKRAAVCAGAGGSFLDDALAQKADLYVTGEMRHHDALRAVKAGMAIVCTLHSNSERAVLKRLQGRLVQKLPGLAVQIARQDRDPFAIR